MKTSFIYLFLLFLPVFIFAQDEPSSEKITCQKLISDHLSSCPLCVAGEKCYTRKDLLNFCSSKEQELIVVDPGPSDCGCPTYGYYYPDTYQYYDNYYESYSGGYNYIGPSYQYGYVVNVGFPGYNNWNWNRARYRNNYSMGGYTGYGGYNTFGNSHQNGGHQGSGGHHNNGGHNNNGSHHNNGGYNGNSGHQGNGGHNTRVHYGSRRGGG